MEQQQHLDNQELVQIILNIDTPIFNLQKYLSIHNPMLLTELIRRTHFLNDQYENERVPIKARLYCIQHNMDDSPVCSYSKCNNKVKWNAKTGAFRKYCCSKHVKLDEEYWKLVYQTNEIKYGVKHPIQNKQILDKMKRTNMEKIGVEFPLQSNDIKNKLMQTNILKYGVPYVLQSSIIREKAINTLISIYGVNNPMRSSIIQNKSVQSMLNHYGVEYPMQSKQIQEKSKQTNIEKYYCEYSASSNIVKSIIRNYFLNTYGVINPFQLDFVKIKSRQTMKNKYGVEFYSQSEKYHMEKKHKYHSEKYPGLTFDSTWEVKVYEFCMDNNIKVEYSPAITYEYEYDGKTWTYHPDFLINDKVYEVKGDNFFRINESTGDEEMFCPYRYDDWSDEHYSWMCGKYEAKHQCMIKNNVVILRGFDMNDLQHAVSGVVNTPLKPVPAQQGM